jgi:hypothetical protein
MIKLPDAPGKELGGTGNVISRHNYQIRIFRHEQSSGVLDDLTGHYEGTMKIGQQADLQPLEGGWQIPDLHRYLNEFHLSARGIVEPFAETSHDNAPQAKF